MKSIGRFVMFAILSATAVVTSGESLRADQTSPSPRVSGTVTYRERMALSPTAVLEVRLDDVSRAGGVIPVVAQLRVENPGQVPLKFEMTYNATAIDTRGRYAVRATISDGNAVLFTSLDTALVLTQGHDAHVDLVLTRAEAAKLPAVPAPAPPAPPLPAFPFTNLPATYTGTLPCAECAGDHYQLNLFSDDSFFLRTTLAGKGQSRDDIGSWALSSDRRVLVLHSQSGATRMFAVPVPGTLRLLDATGLPLAGAAPNELQRAAAFRPLNVRLNMKGVYSKEQEPATFTECSTGQIWPVTVAASRKDLDTAYAGTKSALGSVMLAEIEGVVTPPSADRSTTQNSLTVNKVTRLVPRDSCAPRFTSASLTETYWRLTHLGTRAVTAPTDPRTEPSLAFSAAPPPADHGGSGEFSGSGGCNRLIGTYTVSNATMTLTAGGAMMSCKEKAADEAAFVAALKATRTYRIAGRSLELMDAKGVRLARFEARQATGITKR